MRKLSLSPVTISQCTFEEAFEVTARAGFSGIGLRYDRFEHYLAQGGTVSEVLGWLRHYGLVFTEAAFLAEWMFHGGMPLVSRRHREGGADEHDAVLKARLHRFLAHCETLACANVTVVPALRETGDLRVAADEFGALCDIARPYGVRLGLEFMGTAPQLKDLRAAGEFIAMADRDNGGIVLDTFLFHQGGSNLADLSAVPRGRIFNVQLADARHKPIAQLDMLADRVHPGEGAVAMGEIVEALLAHGYDGWWTVELFNPEYAAAAATTVAARAKAASATLLQHIVHGAST
jgi:4-hydroxyphenylpyruvate dioxygenase